jgi:hypothetical protein
MEIGDKILTRRGRRACEFFCKKNLNYTATAVINIIHTATAVINIGPPAPFPPISLGTSAAIALNNEEVTTIRLLLIYVSLLYKYLFHQSREVSLFVDVVVVCGQFKVIFFFPTGVITTLYPSSSSTQAREGNIIISFVVSLNESNRRSCLLALLTAEQTHLIILKIIYLDLFQLSEDHCWRQWKFIWSNKLHDPQCLAISPDSRIKTRSRDHLKQGAGTTCVR